MFGRLSGLVAAAVLAAAATVLMPSAPAQAAACPGATGVTVIVDYKQLGGGVAQGCAATGGGKTASTNFPAAGFSLNFVQRSPGFVCRVSGKPAADPCVNTPPATAYWSLWWSDGKSGTWTYSTLGAGALKVPTGGYLAFSWQGQAAKAAPGVAPKKRVGVAAAVSSPEPAPTKSPSKSETKDSDKSRKTPEPTPEAEPSEAAAPSAEEEPGSQSADTAKARQVAQEKAERKAERKAAKAAASATSSQSPAAETSTDDSDGASAATTSDPPAQGGASGRVPMWMAIPLLLALVGGIAGVSVWRGRRTPSA